MRLEATWGSLALDVVEHKTGLKLRGSDGLFAALEDGSIALSGCVGVGAG